jgi:ABC-type transporter MlaC component
MSLRKALDKVSPKWRLREGSMNMLMKELFDPTLDVDRMGATLFGKKSKTEKMYQDLRKNKFQTHSLMARGKKR